MFVLTTVYGVLMLGVIGFQIALIFGAPWGHLTQGGAFQGALPLKGRIAAGISIILLSCMALAILSAGGSWPGWPNWAAWAAVAVHVVSTVLNWITPSSAERKLWGPITTLMLVLALAILVVR